MPGFQHAYAQALATHQNGQGSRFHERSSSIKSFSRPARFNRTKSIAKSSAQRPTQRTATERVWGTGASVDKGDSLMQNPMSKGIRGAQPVSGDGGL